MGSCMYEASSGQGRRLAVNLGACSDVLLPAGGRWSWVPSRALSVSSRASRGCGWWPESLQVAFSTMPFPLLKSCVDCVEPPPGNAALRPQPAPPWRCDGALQEGQAGMASLAGSAWPFSPSPGACGASVDSGSLPGGRPSQVGPVSCWPGLTTRVLSS